MVYSSIMIKVLKKRLSYVTKAKSWEIQTQYSEYLVYSCPELLPVETFKYVNCTMRFQVSLSDCVLYGRLNQFN